MSTQAGQLHSTSTVRGGSYRRSRREADRDGHATPVAQPRALRRDTRRRQRQRDKTVPTRERSDLLRAGTAAQGVAGYRWAPASVRREEGVSGLRRDRDGRLFAGSRSHAAQLGPLGRVDGQLPPALHLAPARVTLPDGREHAASLVWRATPSPWDEGLLQRSNW